MTFEPRNIIITGAGSGIGAATAHAFAASSDRLHLFDISAQRLAEVSAGLDLVTTYVVDVVDAQAVRSAVERIERDFGSVDVLVSNAGVFDGLSGIQETTYELWRRIIEVNLTGAFNVIKPVSEVMVRQKSGRIITISSVAATRASPDGLSYDASKAGLEGMTRRLAVDLAPYGITANSVAPGVIESAIQSTSQEILGDMIPSFDGDNTTANQAFLEAHVPARRSGQPTEVAGTIHFLASASAGYINGAVIHVDGGWIAN